jgi:nucleotide-binding universal stress UspA family protein
MSKPIVVALDPDHEDDAPLIVGTALANVTDAPLMVLGAFLHDPITNAVSAGTVDADLRGAVLQNLEARTSGVDADLLVMGGPSAPRVLHDAVVRLDASLLIVGSTHRGAVGHIAPGTTAERLLHGSPCPVVVAPRGLDADWRLRRVAAGFIDLEDGHGALHVAASLARAANAELRAVTAVEPVDWSRSAAIAPYGAGGADEARRIAQQELDAAIAQLPAGTSVSTGVMVGHPADALAGVSADVDLLVCGSRGYGPLRAVLLGSVTHALLRKAQCPVLVVPRGTDGALTGAPERSEAAAS